MLARRRTTNQCKLTLALFSLVAVACSPFTAKVFGQDQAKKAAVMPKAMQDAVTKFEESMLRSIREAYAKLAQTPPLPNQEKEIIGTWNGSSIDDEFRSYWTYKRSADGTFVARAIDQDLAEKTHSVNVTRGKWFSRGRLVYELDDDPKSETPLTVYAIDQIDSKTVVSRLVHEHELPDEWMVLTDQRGVGPNPKPPTGFRSDIR